MAKASRWFGVLVAGLLAVHPVPAPPTSAQREHIPHHEAQQPAEHVPPPETTQPAKFVRYSMVEVPGTSSAIYMHGARGE